MLPFRFSLPLLCCLALASAPATAASLLILDDSDETFTGKTAYEDAVTQILANGEKGFRITGLNNCQTVGGHHQITVDRARRHIWLIESVGDTIRKYDRHGKELLKLDGIHANALAVDEITGNLWALLSNGTIYGGSVVVLDPQGNALARHTAPGFDIVYDSKSHAVWVAGKDLTKIDIKTGRILFSDPVAEWCVISLACDPATGHVWLAARRHPEVEGSTDELLHFDNDGNQLHTIPLNGLAPNKLCVDAKTGSVWISGHPQIIRRYSREAKLQLEHSIDAVTIETDPDTGHLWVVTSDTAQILDTSATPLKIQKLPRPTQQAWCIPF